MVVDAHRTPHETTPLSLRPYSLSMRRALFVVLLLVAAGCVPGAPLAREIVCEEPDPDQCVEMIQEARRHAAQDCRNGDFANITATRSGYSLDCGDGAGYSVTFD